MSLFVTPLGEEIAHLRVMLQDKLPDGESDEGATYKDEELLVFIKRALYSLAHSNSTIFAEEDSGLKPAPDTKEIYEAVGELSLDDRDATLPVQSGYMLELDTLVLKWANLKLSPDTRSNLFEAAPINVPSRAHDTIEQQRRF